MNGRKFVHCSSYHYTHVVCPRLIFLARTTLTSVCLDVKFSNLKGSVCVPEQNINATKRPKTVL